MTTALKIVPELRNFAINGNFDFWQRGTSIALTTANVYQADRFSALRSSSWTGTYSQSTDVPTAAQSGFQSRFSALITNGTGAAGIASDFYFKEYLVEGQDYQALHGRPCRLQFWVKSSVPGTYSCSFANLLRDRSYIATYTINSANTWERKTIDLVMDSTGTWQFDNAAGLRVRWILQAGSTWQNSAGSWLSGNYYASNGQTNWAATTGATFQVAQVAIYQIQAGSGVILPFVRAGRTIQQELAMCQRYYEKSYDIDTAPGTNTNPGRFVQTGSASATSIDAMGIKFAVAKRTISYSMVGYRASGTLNLWDWNDQATSNTGTPLFGSLGMSGLQVGLSPVSGSPTAGRAAIVIGHWTCDAEL